MSRPIGGQLYRCPRCSRAGEWTDGTVKAAGDERDEYWCQTCGEESPLEDCEVVAPAKATARCDNTELPVDQCACAEHRPDLAKVEPAEKVQVRVRFTARCNTPCDLCDGGIREGELMGYADGDARVCKRHLS